MQTHMKRVINKSLISILGISILVVLFFNEVPSEARDFEFFYFLFLLSYGILLVNFAEMIINPPFTNMGQKISFAVVPLIYVIVVIAVRVIFSLLGIQTLYFVITTLILMLLTLGALSGLSNTFKEVARQDAGIRQTKVQEGIQNIRIFEIASVLKQNPHLSNQQNIKNGFELLEKAIKYQIPTNAPETAAISSKINAHVEETATLLAAFDESTDETPILEKMTSIRLLIEEKNKIAQLYYK